KSLEQRSFERVAMSGDIAWRTSWGYGLIGVDLSDPAAPSEVGRLAFPFAHLIDISGQYAYVAKWTNGGLFGVVDLSDPAAPTLVWQGPIEAQPWQLEVEGSHAYTAEVKELNDARYGGLRVYDLADPASPAVIAHLDDGCGTATDLAVDSDVSLLYLACESGMQVIDIADPAAPAVVSSFASEGNHFNKVEVRGDRAWFADIDGVHELGVSDPTAPVQVGLVPTGHQGVQRLAALDDGRVLALGGITGLHVLSPGDDTGPEATPLENKVPVGGLSGDAGEALLFSIQVPAGAAMLNILAYGGTGDISLYASNGAEPSPGDADARSERRGNSETIRIARPAAGTYYIKVVGVKAFDRLTLQARY